MDRFDGEARMVLRIEKVSRRFGEIAACSDVSLRVAPGEVVALLGENGAGKSTLLSIASGFVQPDSGRVSIGDEILKPGEPGAAIRAGVGTAFQHFSLSPELTVEQNLQLARISRSGAQEHLPESLPRDARVGALSVPEQQQVEFVKARILARNVLLLDEPTSLLGGADVARVLEGIRNAARASVACLFVTHRLREAIAIADRILVMRRGWLVEQMTRSTDGWPGDVERQLLAAMFGDVHATDEDEHVFEAGHRPEAGRIEIAGSLGRTPQDISLEMNRTLAVAGIAGNGQAELVSLLAGDTARSVSIFGAGATRNLEGRALREWVRRHVAIVPEDRIREGGSPSMSVAETAALRELAAGRLSVAGMVSKRRLKRRAAEILEGWGIQPSEPAARFGPLSGGNVQRVILARALDPLPQLLLAVHPAHGLDHVSTEFVRRELRSAAEAGSAVVTIEQDLDDALRHSDSIAVMYQGRLSPVISTSEADRSVLQQMMVSGWTG